MTAETSFEIVRADAACADTIAPLFDAYRGFYDLQSDLDAARRFLADRLSKDDSVVFLAREVSDPAAGLGFTQLYATFSSLRMAPMWRLNDLFVAPAARRRGVGRALMTRAIDFARSTSAGAVELVTQRDNAKARALYESLGFAPDPTTLEYAFEITPR